MKKIIIILFLLTTISTTIHAEETMPLIATGIVFKCLNETIKPFNTCFKINNVSWGKMTPGFNPKPGTKINVVFTLGRVLYNDCSEHDDEFYVKNIKILKIK